MFQIHLYIPRCSRTWRPGGNHWLNNEKSPMLIKIFKILQTFCVVYGWEVVNNYVCSGRSMDNPVTKTSLPAERSDLRHPCHTQNFYWLELQVYSFSNAWKHDCILPLNHKQHRIWSILKILISIGLFSLLSQWLPPGLHILRHLGIY